MILANTWKTSYFMDTRTTQNELLTKIHTFAISIEMATTQEQQKHLLTNTLFRFHAMIGTLDQKVHFCHQLIILKGNNWEQSEKAYVVLLGLGSIAQPVAFDAKQVFAVITTTIPSYAALHDKATTLEHLTTTTTTTEAGCSSPRRPSTTFPVRCIDQQRHRQSS